MISADDVLDHVSAERIALLRPQLLLSCAWRIVKACSSLMTTLLSFRMCKGKATHYLLADDDLLPMGLRLRRMLAAVRHHGAFRSLVPTFYAICCRCTASSLVSINELPREWMMQSLDEMQFRNNIGVTRRSAGLPYMLLASLQSETNAARPLLRTCISHLSALAAMPLPENHEERHDLNQVSLLPNDMCFLLFVVFNSLLT